MERALGNSMLYMEVLDLGERNEGNSKLLDFATFYNLIIVNTHFRKKEGHLITFKSDKNHSQINYFPY